MLTEVLVCRHTARLAHHGRPGCVLVPYQRGRERDRSEACPYHRRAGCTADDGTVSTLFFWFVITAIGLAEVSIIVAALRIRVASDPARGLLGARASEVLWTLLPALLVAAMLVLSYQSIQDTEA